QHAFEVAAHLHPLLAHRAAEDAGRAHEQDGEQEAIDADIHGARAEPGDGEGFDHADQEAADDRAPDVAHAADYHRRDALERNLLAHERARLLVVEREEKAAERSEQAADDEDHGPDAPAGHAEPGR